MTLEQLVALTLIEQIPRKDLVARLRADDPHLAEAAAPVIERARVACARAAAAGVLPLAWSDPGFPQALLSLDDCPPLLWYKGDPSGLARPSVALVGSRTASAVALEMASRLAADLASLGVAVVSGLARGVDSAAHRGALGAGGFTAAVLGSGLGRIYPPEHLRLAGDIASHGVLLSEYPVDTPPLAFHFPQRNRLISGLSQVIVVIEASERSGSLITAARALDQGREVMAVPGNALSGRNKGGHALIRDGAKLVETADDIVEALGLGAAVAVEMASSVDSTNSCGEPSLRDLEAGRAYDLDELAGVLGLPAAGLLTRLSEWELRGVVRRLDGGRFMLAS